MHSNSFFRPRARRYGAALACLAALGAAAQAQTSTPAPQRAALPAAMGSAPAAPSGFTSVFGSYQPYQDQVVDDWKNANDEVGRIGGWRAYTSEANERGAAAPPANSPAPRSDSAPENPHAGHAKP